MFQAMSQEAQEGQSHSSSVANSAINIRNKGEKTS
jgi:hypothetical protein